MAIHNSCKLLPQGHSVCWCTDSCDSVTLLWARHTATPAPSLSVLAEKSSGPYRCLEKKCYFNKHSVSFCSLGCIGKLLKFTRIGMGLSLFFPFLSIILATKETWCRKSSLDSLHMAPVAKETPDDACRPLCRAPKCRCALGGLKSTWLKWLWRNQNCCFSIWYHEGPKHCVWDWFYKIIALRVISCNLLALLPDCACNHLCSKQTTKWLL